MKRFIVKKCSAKSPSRNIRDMCYMTYANPLSPLTVATLTSEYNLGQKNALIK